jgi:uncharacterized damage-inducible protein DinB
MSAEHDELLFLLNRVRAAVIRTTEGVPADRLRTPGVPSGTNLLGLLRHLTAMETQWFERLFLGDGGEVDASMTVPETTTYEQVVSAYRTACARSDEITRACPDLSTMSKQPVRLPESTSRDAAPATPRRVSLRTIVAHMLEETSRHAGHADILREQLDGETDL